MIPFENPIAAWFCVCSQPKHEHIATAHLRKLDDVEVFLPRVRFKRATRLKSAWVTEALFPGYLFARFDWRSLNRQVRYAAGVRGIVHFGESIPAIPEEIIASLKSAIGTSELHTISPDFTPGDGVQITEGALRGLHAVVTEVMPGRERIAVLMDLLGQQTTVEVTSSSLVKGGPERVALFQRNDELE